MRTIIFLSLIQLSNSLVIFSQQRDTLMAKQFELKAKELFDRFKYDSAANYYKQAAEIYEKEENWLNCVRNYRKTASYYLKSYRIDTSLFYTQKAITIATNEFSGDYKEKAFEVAELRLMKGYIFLNKMIYENDSSFLEKAVELFQDANEIVSHMEDSTKLLDAKIWNHIGNAFMYMGKYEQAKEYCYKSLETRQKYLGNNHIDVGQSLYRLGAIYFAKKDYTKALEYHKAVLKIRLKNYGKYHPDVAWSYLINGELYSKSNKTLKAISFYKKALAIRKKVFGKHSVYVSQCYSLLATNYFGLNEHKEGLKYSSKKTKILLLLMQNNLHHSPNPFNLDGILNANLGNIIKAIRLVKLKPIFYIVMGDNFCDIGKYNKALACYKEALKLSLPGNYKQYWNASGYSRIGEVYFIIGDYDKALDYLIKGLRILVKYKEEFYVINSITYQLIGDTYIEKREFNKAFEYYEKAIKSLLSIYGKEHSIVSKYYGELYALTGDYNKSLKYLYPTGSAHLVSFY